MDEYDDILTITETYAMRLYEQLAMPWFAVDLVADVLGVARLTPEQKEEAATKLDSDLIARIADYLIGEEELLNDTPNPDSSPEDWANVLSIGVMLYGWEDSHGRAKHE